MQVRQEKIPGKSGEAGVYDRLVILEKDVFTGEYAPGISPALINSFFIRVVLC